MFMKVKIQPLAKLGYLATAQTSACQSAGEKSCVLFSLQLKREHQRSRMHPATDQREAAASSPSSCLLLSYPSERQEGCRTGCLKNILIHTSTCWTLQS